ncbi:hypothetical protein B0H66DRAFT_11602 [Apodospora peruviana]|uniref:Secreted protein n=1 Tax=Apodospora peruviana TaxID=516989 RepID=A0AAE0IPX7_9PEZI|nr:hypothetical protein B0H66DRAFT_11602 [Apodospora peruviana]
MDFTALILCLQVLCKYSTGSKYEASLCYSWAVPCERNQMDKDPYIHARIYGDLWPVSYVASQCGRRRPTFPQMFF